MKKIILMAALALGTFAQAQQISVVRPGGLELADGETFTTNSISSSEDAPNKMRFRVLNLTDDTMIIGAKVLSFSNNTDGSMVQLCFNTCLYEITPGLIIPNVPIEAGQATPSADDHFWNMNPGTGGAINYHLAFVKLEYNEEEDTYTELEELLDFYYIYDATAGVTSLDGLQQMGLTVENTIIKNTLNISATQNASLQLFDATGKLVKTVGVKSGAQAIDLAALSTGVYMARFTTAANKTATVKVVKN